MKPEEALQIVLDQFEACRIRYMITGSLPADTILAKLEWSKIGESERQFNDALNVAKVQFEDLNRAYLSKWAKELGIVEWLQRLLSEIETLGH